MFIGHLAVGLAAKRAAPRVPLWVAFLAVQWADLVWPVFVLLGWERVELDPHVTGVTPFAFVSYPYSHSLLALGLWGVLLGGAWWVWTREFRGAVWVGLLVVSHWVLDWVSHRPDMPLAPGWEGRYGLGLWNSLPATLIVEGAMFGAGAWLYWRSALSEPRPGLRRSRWVFWALVSFLAVMYLGNLFGPPPPSAMAGAASALALWLLVLWARFAEPRATA